ncbi:MAG: hypothetical protein ACFB5Z_08230 [Elainellaceae cyanobacterium]
MQVPLKDFQKAGTYSPRTLTTTVGLTCLAGFLLDAVSLIFSADLYSIQWRLSFLEQMGDRAILLVIGLALLLYGVLPNRGLTKNVGVFCLMAGIVVHLVCILSIHDTIQVREQAATQIDDRAVQLQNQLQEGQDSAEGAERLSLTDVDQAVRQIKNQSESLKQDVQVDLTRAGILSIANLMIIGLALIALGRFGLQNG